MSYSVLVLDDDIGVCTILSRILADEHYEVYTSQTVSGAAETLAKRSFDAYLLDYRLLDGTGLQVAEQVRQRGSIAPIILISGYGATDIAAKAITLEVFDVVQKPFTRETICNTLSKALHDKHLAVPSFERPEPGTPEVSPTPSRKSPLIALIILALIIVATWIYFMFR